MVQPNIHNKPAAVLPYLQSIWKHRFLLGTLTYKAVIIRYSQTVAGPLWLLFQPSFQILWTYFIFGVIANFKTQANYVPYVVIGTSIWFLVQGSIDRLSLALVNNESLVSKVAFPKLLLPLSVFCAVVVDFLIIGLLALIASASLGIWLHTLWVPLLGLAGLSLLALSGGILCSLIVLFVRDVKLMLPMLMQAMFFGTPVAYATSMLTIHTAWIATLSPLAVYIRAIRSGFRLEAPPSMWLLGSHLAITLGVAYLTLTFFIRKEAILADEL